jgi:hypothetical protein
MTYVVRNITLTLELGQGSFGGTGANQLTVAGLRVICQMNASSNSLYSALTAIVRVYGLTLDQMNQLTKAGLQWAARTNKLTVSAGDAVSGMPTIFIGNVYDAYPDFSEMPDVAFMMSAVIDPNINMKSTTSSSYTGNTSVATIMGALAVKAGLTLENNNVNVNLSSPYYYGTTLEQISRCAQAANINYWIDENTKTLAIWPKSGSRSTVSSIPVISPETGMIGYPRYQQSLVIVRAIFNPTIKFGGQVMIQSQLTPASGTWTIVGLEYNLASQLPGGPWEMQLTCNSPTVPVGGVAF